MHCGKQIEMLSKTCEYLSCVLMNAIVLILLGILSTNHWPVSILTNQEIKRDHRNEGNMKILTAKLNNYLSYGVLTGTLKHKYESTKKNFLNSKRMLLHATWKMSTGVLKIEKHHLNGGRWIYTYNK
jgi:hypothetical protein